MEEAGEPLTLDTFRATYHGLLEAYFGPRFALDPELDIECLRIPHFYNAFYVYKYATGISAAVALSQKVLHGGAADVEAYLGFLKSGGQGVSAGDLATGGRGSFDARARGRGAGLVRAAGGGTGDAAGVGLLSSAAARDRNAGCPRRNPAFPRGRKGFG